MATLPARPSRVWVIHLHGSRNAVLDTFTNTGRSLGLNCESDTYPDAKIRTRTCWPFEVRDDSDEKTLSMEFYETTTGQHSKLSDSQKDKITRIADAMLKNPEVGIDYIEACEDLRGCSVNKEQLEALRRNANAGSAHSEAVSTAW